MNDTITLGEIIIVTAVYFVGILVYIFGKTIVEHLKENRNAQFTNRYGGLSRDDERTRTNLFKLNHYQ